MLDSLKIIGEKNLDYWLDYMIKYDKVSSSNKKTHLIRIIFDIDNKRIDFDWKEIQESVLKKYKWIGHTFSASRENVMRLTFDNLKYLNSIENMLKNKAKLDIDLYTYLSEIKNNFDLSETEKAVNEYVRKEKLKPSLYTICIKKERELDLATLDSYTQFLESILKYTKDLREGICYICGKKGKVFSDPAFEGGSLLKVYVTDKKGFISGISKNEESLVKTFSICADCRWSLIIGERYVRHKLMKKVGPANIYVIPRGGMNEYNDGILEAISNIFDKTAYGWDPIKRIGEELKRYDEYIKEWYTLNIIFGEKEQASFKLYRFVQEVPITNLRILIEKIEYIANKAAKYWKDGNNNWMLNLSNITQLYPLRKSGSKTIIRPLIELFTSLFNITPFPLHTLLEQAVLLARIYRFESYSNYNISKPKDSDIELSYKMIKFNYFLLLLKELNMIPASTNSKIEVSEELDSKITEWFNTMGYNDLQRGLFLLGYLISQVGSEQYKKGDEKKSILDKLDFKGMKEEKIKSLASEMLQHLRNYRILKYNEPYYYKMLEMINKSQQELDKDPIHNLFYIVSGYAYGTYRVIKGGDTNE